MSRRTSLIALAAAVAAVAVAPVGAEPVDPKPRTITVEVDGGDLRVRGHKLAAPGYVRLRFRAQDTTERYSLAVIELDRGRTRADVDRLQLAGLQDAEQVEAVGRLVAGATFRSGAEYVTRIVTRDRRYVVVDITHEDQQSVSFRPSRRAVGITPGRHDASIAIDDDGISAPSALPRKGLIRIANRGERPHSLVALRLPRGTSTAEARRKVRAGVEPARIGRRYDLAGVLSGGTVNRVEARLPRGRYVVVSYYGGLGAGSDAARGLVAGVEVV